MATTMASEAINTEHPLSRYASDSMLRLWSPEWNVVAERAVWLNVLIWMGRNTTAYDHIDHFEERLRAYEHVRHKVRLGNIRELELVTKHDLKARLEEFNTLATRAYAQYYRTDDSSPVQCELVHWGMTSADVVDNVMLIRVQQSLRSLLNQATAVDDGPLSKAVGLLSRLLNTLPLRGIKGAIGTQQDLLALVGSTDKCLELDEHLRQRYAFPQVFDSIGQVYPRSTDVRVAHGVWAAMIAIGAYPLWRTLATGYVHMFENMGDQWSEGDVSTSVVRRVAWPGLFLAADAAFRGVEPWGYAGGRAVISRP